MLEDYETDFVSKATIELFACQSPLKPPMCSSNVRMQSFTKNWPVKGPATSCKMADTGSPRVTTVPGYDSAVSRLRTRPIKWKMPLDTLPNWKTFTLMSRWFTFHLIPQPFYSLWT